MNIGTIKLAAVSVAAIAGMTGAAAAQTVFASGQFFDGTDRINRFFELDLATGQATPASPPLAFFPQAGLAGTPDGRLLGLSQGILSEIDPLSGDTTTVAVFDVNATSLDVLTDGRIYAAARNADGLYQQFARLDPDNETTTLLGSDTEIGDAIDNARSTPLGTATPFIIALGSVGSTLYGVDADSGSTIAVDPDTGEASVVGDVGALTDSLTPRFTGFAALSGADTNADGEYDTLVVSINFDNDYDSLNEPLKGRFGGIATIDLQTGEGSIVGDGNPGIIYFGMGAIPATIPCIADWNGDGEVDINDFFAYLADFEDGDSRADLNNDGEIDINDFFIYLQEFEAGCP